MANLADILEHSAAAHPERVAIIDGDRRFTYRELDERASIIAGELVAWGVTPGDRVAFSCPNVAEFPMIYFGILKAGAAAVPLNVLLKGREVAYHLEDSSAKVYFAHGGTPELPIATEGWDGFSQVNSCEQFVLVGPGEPPAGAVTLDALLARGETPVEAIDVEDDDTAVVLYTSGTTGQPKGAELRHRNMRANLFSVAEVFACDRSRPDTHLAVLPLYHSYGQTVVQNSALAFGGTIVMLPRFDAAAALTLMEEHAVTFFSAVPTMYWGLMEHVPSPARVAAIADRLRVANCGGAALPVEMHRRFKDTFGVTILEGYGLSETSPVVSFNRPGTEPRVGSIGLPIPGVDMALVREDWSEIAHGSDEVGEIAIRGDNVMKGYLGRPEATAAVLRDGWFRSGDLARRDSDGYYYIVDRAKDLIIRGGYNVYPREIEEVLMQHPAVSLVAVIGVPHDSLGEEVMAVVVPSGTDSTPPAELVAWARERLAGYKYPRTVKFVDQLPLTSTGKILKRELKDRLVDA